MRKLYGLALAAGLALVSASDAKAQIVVTTGSPYGYGYPGLVAPGVTGYYQSGYTGVAPGLGYPAVGMPRYYRPGYVGVAPAVVAPAYRYPAYGYGYRGVRRGPFGVARPYRYGYGW